jgi:small subunit ribosomal protein S13
LDNTSESSNNNAEQKNEKEVKGKLDKKNSQNQEFKKDKNKDKYIESKVNENKEMIDEGQTTKDKSYEKTKKTDTTSKNIESKSKDHKDDFRYIVRIANTDIDGEKTLERGLTSIKGIGMHMSTLVIDSSGLDRKLKMGNLTDKQIEKIQESLEKITETAPNWMLNHQKDTELGKDIHFIGTEIEMRLRDEINIMKKIRSYKGIRHERGLTVRGQRTRANNRKGLSLGVSKKGVQKK